MFFNQKWIVLRVLNRTKHFFKTYTYSFWAFFSWIPTRKKSLIRTKGPESETLVKNKFLKVLKMIKMHGKKNNKPHYFGSSSGGSITITLTYCEPEIIQNC